MFKNLFHSNPLWQEQGFAFLRVVFGLLLVYHGLEVFNGEKMKEYAGWDTFKDGANPLLKVYVGKGSEFITGVLLTLGFCTRIVCIWIVAAMGYITFFVGNGKFWYEDQHPFMFVLMGMVFFFAGGGKYSVDHLISKK